MYEFIHKIARTVGYTAPIKAATVSIPQVYIIGKRLIGSTIEFIGNTSPTLFIPENVAEQITTGALFPGSAASLVGSRLRLGDRLDDLMYRTTGRRVPLRRYLDYAIPAVGGTLVWDGTMAVLRMIGIEGAERSGLIPFDTAVAMTLSSAYAYIVDNLGRSIRWIKRS